MPRRRSRVRTPSLAQKMIEFSFLDKKYRVDKNDLEMAILLMEDRHPGTPEINEKQLVVLSKRSYAAIARDTENGKIIGMAVLGTITRLEGKKGFIEDVVINENYRGKGYGRKLMEMLIKKAKTLGVLQLQLTSNPRRVAANHLYKSMGFKIHETNCYKMDLQK